MRISKVFMGLIIVHLMYLNCDRKQSIQTLNDLDNSLEVQPSHVTSEIIDGVKIIHNEELSNSYNMLLPELILGSDSTDYYFGFPSLVREDHEGNIYVVHGSRNDEIIISKFTNDGQHIRDIGRKGQGPGEFISINQVNFFPDNRLWVYDAGNYRYQIFSPDGEYIEGKRIVSQYFVEAYFQNNFYYFRNIFGYVPDSIAYRNFRSDFVYLFHKTDTLFNTISYIGKKKSGIYNEMNVPRDTEGKVIHNRDTEGEIMEMSSYSKSHVTINDNGVVYVAYQRLNLIEIYQNDILEISIERKLSEDIENDIRDKGMSNFISGGIGVDSRGNIYVLRNNTTVGEPEIVIDEKSGRESRIKPWSPEITLEVYNSNGWLLHNIPLPTGIWYEHIFIGKGDKIYLCDPTTYTITRYKAIFEDK